MSLRSRLFLVFGTLMGLLVGAEWALVTALTRDLEDEVAQIAFDAGSQVLSSFFPSADADEGGQARGFFVDEELDHGDHNHPHARSFRFNREFWSDRGDMGLGIDERLQMVELEAEALELQQEQLREALAPLHEQLLRDHELTFEPSQIVRRIEVDRRGPRPGVIRFPKVGASGDGEQLVILELRDRSEGERRGIVFGGGHKISLHLTTEVTRLGPADLGGPGGPGGGRVAIGVSVGGEGLEQLHDLAPGIHVIQHEAFNEELFLNQLHGAAILPPTPSNAIPADADPVSADEAEPMSVEIPISSEGIDKARRAWLRRMILGSAAILGLGLVLAGWVAHRVSRPLRELSRVAREVGDGALGKQVVDETGDREVGEAMDAFNQMSLRLAALDAEASSLRQREHLTEIGEMARGLAHAMRNPLHLLGLSVEQLVAHGDESSGALATSARDQIQRIDHSLRSFLALSSGGAGVPEEVSVDDLARDVALELLQRGPSGVHVLVQSPDRCTLQAVAAELRAVLHVLVVNAVEASTPGDEVVVRVSCADDQVSMEVLDRGPGLAPEVRAKLFTPHVTTKEQGAGMGLFLAHRIATSRYGGQLTIEDREGGGTRALLTLGDRGDGHA